MESDDTFIHDVGDAHSPDDLLHTYNLLFERVEAEYGGEYEVTSGDPTTSDDGWSREIRVRKGMKIGTAIELNWKATTPNQLGMQISESSKLGVILMTTCVLGFMAVGAVWAGADIPPLDLLPGRKLSVAIGAMLGLLPGGVAYAALASNPVVG